ncbi:MAG: HAD-IC family P-type ATPase [Candidatus Nomurabacteria bacterium]|jgi:cation-transporting ATPase E|nr:HAD-IC family P-type ATPase [Candidatus Nomurabacteria bacterium]
MKKFSGLSSAEVHERVKNGLTNEAPNKSSRSLVDILRANILTRFNALLTILAVVVIAINRSPFNALFGLAMIINSGVGIFQELRAKKTLDKLAILSAPHVMVIRDGKSQEIAVNDVVQDDLIKLRLGDQVVADGVILDSNQLEIDESLLTGESDPMIIGEDSQVLSGSIVVAGSGIMRATNVGAASYSSKLTLQAKKFQRASSELISSTNRLLKWISRLLIIVAPILVLGQLRLDFSNWREATIHATAAIVGMIPEGLVLLTSAAFMLATITLARRKVLVQQMPAVETLARVDTLLLDKTGTLTEGNIRFEAVILDESEQSDDTVKRVLVTIAHRAKSPTNDAIGKALEHIKPLEFSNEVPFSSTRKWSAISVNNRHWILGAPEILFEGQTKSTLYNKISGITRKGKRVLALMSSTTAPSIDHLPNSLTPCALVVLTEKIRDDAAQTLAYFAEQNVNIKIISGDSPLTVGAVAKAVGLGNVKVFDARELPDPEKQKRRFAEIIKTYNVFGRVQPEQKRMIAAALQSQGHVVAMTGDGVNDALALKKADLGIAMNSGSAATKAVAEIVLLDNKFSHLPRVLAEGRRVISNIERVANLFIIKNVYSLVLALYVTVAGLTYPYLPAQMTVISALSIGIPAFFLALAPNNAIYRAGFLKRVLKFAIPVGIIAAIAMMVDYTLVHNRGMSMNVAGTSVSIVVMIIVFWVLILLARPLKGWKLGLITVCASVFVVIISTPFIATRFNYELDLSVLPLTLVIGLAGAAVVTVVRRMIILFERKKMIE